MNQFSYILFLNYDLHSYLLRDPNLKGERRVRLAEIRDAERTLLEARLR